MSERSEHLARTLAAMADAGVDVLLLGREGNARFVSGANRLWLAGTRPFAPGCVVVGATGAVHLLATTDEGVPPDVAPDHLLPMSWSPANLVGAVAALPGVAGARRVGVDGLTPLFAPLLAAALPGAELVDGEALVRSVRRVKSEHDVAAIHAAVALAEDALRACVEALAPGVRERDLLGAFEEQMAALGTTTPAFEGSFTVVGPDGPPRALVTDRALAAGDLVHLRAGVLLDGWEGLVARTWCCGEPDAAARGAAARWRAALDDAVAACRAGAVAADVRAGGAGLDGIGLGHEVLADDDVLEPGVVAWVEAAAGPVSGGEVVEVTAHGPRVLGAFGSGPLLSA